MNRAAGVLVCVAALMSADVGARGPRPRSINADLVFDESGQVRSDGFATTLCADGVNISRYCASAASAIGPECSRISYGTLDGDYSFRTLSSEPCTLPASGQRRASLDFTDRVSGSTCSVSKTEGGVTRTLDACGPQVIDDVRIDAEHLFAVSSGESSTVTIYLALHSPPIANTTHFVVEYASPLVVVVNPDGSRTASTATGDLATLYDITYNRTKTKVTKTLIGVYHLPLRFTARGIE